MVTGFVTTENEELFDEKLWEEVMFDFFPEALTDEEIEEELDNIWND